MTREEARKLLGGYATGTLTDAEREALFAAALEDQELFDELAGEEALREALAEPGAKAGLLAALEESGRHAWWWNWRPLAGALAMAGLVLGGVAVWRATRAKPAAVMVAQVEKAPAAAPAVEAPAAQSAPQAAPRRQVQAPKAKRLAAKDAVVEGAVRETASKEAKDEANVPAVTATAAPPPPTPAVPPEPKAVPAATATAGGVQQVAQMQAPTPSPGQQQAQVQAEASQLRAEKTAGRALAVSGFRDATGGVVGGIAGGNLAMPMVHWTILRGEKGETEAPPGTVLDEGESVRLRIVTRSAGMLTVSEGEKVVVSAEVQASAPFDTPPIPSTGADRRVLRLTLKPAAGNPLSWNVTLRYGK